MAVIVIINPSSEVASATPGMIVMWYGLSTAIPSGYILCDGTGGTPDLRGRFVRGASSDSVLLDTGGANTHYHEGGTVGTGGSHSHSVSFSAQASSGARNVYKSSVPDDIDADDGHTHSFSSSFSGVNDHNHSYTGNSSEENNLPQYMKIHFIMRI